MLAAKYAKTAVNHAPKTKNLVVNFFKNKRAVTTNGTKEPSSIEMETLPPRRTS
jgi:hypothetical protein